MANTDHASGADGAGDPSASSRKGIVLALALIVLLTIVVFLPVLRAEFVTWDDNRNFLGNPAYRGLGPEQLRWMWSTTLMGHYVPVTWMTLGLDYVLWGMNPAGYHAVNLVLHAINAALLFAVALALYPLGVAGGAPERVRGAVVAALVFAIHPLRVESVAWITERRDVLSMAFSLASLLAYVHAVGGKFNRRWYGGSLALFALALLSKATVVTLPAVLLLIDAYPLRRLGTREGRATVARELAPYALLSAAAGLVSLFVLHPPGQLSIGEKLAVSAYSFAFYLWKTVFPVSLSPLYQMPRHVDPARWSFVVSYIVCVAFAVAVWRAWKTRRGLSIALMSFAVITIPLLGVVQNGPQIAADRYTYHASAALALVAGAALMRWRSRGLLVGVAAVLGWWGTLTWRQSGKWKDSDTLWTQVLRVDSTSAVALFAMGDVRIAQRRGAEALDLYRRAVQIDSDYAAGHNNLGILYAEQGDYAAAVREHRRAIELRPDLAEAHANLGIALARTGQDSGAIAAFERALAIQPNLAGAEINWGNVLVRQGRPGPAVPHYRRAIALDGRDARAHLNLGVTLAQLGEFDTASSEFEQALSLDPTLEDARGYLEEARRHLGRPPR